jgi:hypothetical protein
VHVAWVVTRRVVWWSGTRSSQYSPLLPDCWRLGLRIGPRFARTRFGSGRQQLASRAGSGWSVTWSGDDPRLRFHLETGARETREGGSRSRARPEVGEGRGAVLWRSRCCAVAVAVRAFPSRASNRRGAGAVCCVVTVAVCRVVAVAVCDAGVSWPRSHESRCRLSTVAPAVRQYPQPSRSQSPLTGQQIGFGSRPIPSSESA